MYGIFIRFMDFLSSLFGYEDALAIKDLINFSNGVGVGFVILLHLMIQFFLQVSIDPFMRKDVALERLSTDPPEFVTPARNFNEVSEAILAFILHKFSNEEEIRFKKLHRISTVIKVLGVAFFLFGVLLSFYKYLPNK